MVNKCYICGIGKFDIIKKTEKGFLHHYKVDHYMWNYLFYMYNLEQKDINEYNGIETYVHQLIEEEDIKWFPILRAIAVKEEDQ